MSGSSTELTSDAEHLEAVAALNRGCHCISVDRQLLEHQLASDLPSTKLAEQLQETHPSLFASSPVFLARPWLETMVQTIRAIEAVAANDAFQSKVLARAPAIARADPGPKGALFGYDFHLAESGPQLIEVNTNAGGALLGLYLARAQRACCAEVASLTTGRLDLGTLETELLEMFRHEHRLAGSSEPLSSVAIVDEQPEQQFLLPEMELFRFLFERHGIHAVLRDPGALDFDDGRLLDTETGEPIQLVYNRLTDFYLEQEHSQSLRAAYEQGAIALTPHPHVHALFADKRNLALFSDEEELAALGVAASDRSILTKSVPATRPVSKDAAEELWSQRKDLFFKPNSGFGSRGAYDGKKLTRKVFASILEGGYVAQTKIPPSERRLIIDGEERDLKVDIRCFVYNQEILSLGARLYRGQTTNMRTTGGGLATVFATKGL